MFELITIAIFLWLLAKCISLAFRLTWGAAKVIASSLMAIALPLLVVCFLFIGGLTLILPIVLMGIALTILMSCVR